MYDFNANNPQSGSMDSGMEGQEQAGSIAEFIDQTILRCLIDYERGADDISPGREGGGKHLQCRGENTLLPNVGQSLALDREGQKRPGHAFVDRARVSQEGEEDGKVEDGLGVDARHDSEAAKRDAAPVQFSLLSASPRPAESEDSRDTSRLSYSAVLTPCVAQPRAAPSPVSDPHNRLLPASAGSGGGQALRNVGAQDVGHRQDTRVSKDTVVLKVPNKAGAFDGAGRKANPFLPSQSAPLDLTCNKRGTGSRAFSTSNVSSQLFGVTSSASSGEEEEGGRGGGEDTGRERSGTLLLRDAAAPEADLSITTRSQQSSSSPFMGRVVQKCDISSRAETRTPNSIGRYRHESGSGLEGREKSTVKKKIGIPDNSGGQCAPQEACGSPDWQGDAPAASSASVSVASASASVSASASASVSAPASVSASSASHGSVCGPAACAVRSGESLGHSAGSGSEDTASSGDGAIPARRVLSVHKATDKVKKRLQRRYFEGEAKAANSQEKSTEKKGQKRPLEAEEEAEKPQTFQKEETTTTAVETFDLQNVEGKVSNWRIGRWKKRKLQNGEESKDPGSKSKQWSRQNRSNRGKQKHGPFPGKQKHGPFPGKQKQAPKGKQVKDKKKKEEEKKPSRLDDLEDPGFIEYGPDEEEGRLTQTEITEAVDVTSATKYFELNLKEYGPYSINYSRNGRHLLLGGEQGHIAAFEWQTKRLAFDMNTERTKCVQWMHQETMFAAAHPKSVCFYDNQGIELHALTNLDAVSRMEFLPHHMLLATSNEKGFLGYTDVSMGTRVAGISTGLGRLDVMTQNPANAVIYLGHAAGTVTLWSPSVKKPLVKMLAHKAPVRSLAIDSTGNYLATSGVDKRLKIFDLRTYQMLKAIQIPMGASSLTFSQRGLLAAAMGNRVQVYKDCRGGGVVTPYLSHIANGSLRGLQFCPFEDVLGAGHQRGFSSLIVPGAGEANIDALSVNPMANRKQRQHMEVRLLLDKLQPEMIGLTNWLWDIERKGDTQDPAPHTITKKLGKKQKEELQREKARASVKEKKKQQQQQEKEKQTDSNPLSRFRKSS